MDATKRCDRCGHSMAAHLDGLRCALCGCVPGRDRWVQTPLAFRGSLPARVTSDTRKR